MSAPSCRSCGARLGHTFVDLGLSPLCQKHVSADALSEMEPFYPLHVWVCERCFLVQLEEVVPPAELFGDGSYAYFSSYSDTWLHHAETYANGAVRSLGLGPQSRVIEIASNDGYLLQYFRDRGIPVLGIEPATNTAEVARSRGIETITRFFGQQTAKDVVVEHGHPDLVVANNVLAHVPDINDFVSGLAVLLGESGVATLEFPHLMRLVEDNLFDTIYHEHFSYLSLIAVEPLFARHELVVFDVEELATHGGSLRIHVRRAGSAALADRVRELREREERQGLRSLEYYDAFRARVHEAKWRLLEFLIGARRAGKRIAGYGAPGKGNTLLNYCGIRQDLLDYTVDRSPHKQGGFLPGSRVPILHPDEIARTRPDYVLILPWNLREEIMSQMQIVRSWGGQFVVPLPELKVYP